jgi:hypothetical protein
MTTMVSCTLFDVPLIQCVEEFDTKEYTELNFGGFDSKEKPEEDGGEEKKKTRQEVMSELIAKSKLYKVLLNGLGNTYKLRRKERKRSKKLKI